MEIVAKRMKTDAERQALKKLALAIADGTYPLDGYEGLDANRLADRLYAEVAQRVAHLQLEDSLAAHGLVAGEEFLLPKGTMVYAEIGKRFWANSIDGIILYVVNTAIGVGILFMLDINLLNTEPLHTFTLQLIISFFVLTIYHTLLVASPWQGSVGKRLVGIRVTDMQGNRISVGRSLGRSLAQYLSGLIFMIGYLMAFNSPKRQALHDRIAGTVVLAGKG